MKQFIARTLTLIAVTVTGLTATAHAQSPSVLKVDIPFTFSFGRQTFPAGNYVLLQTPGFLTLRDQRSRTLATALTQDVLSRTPAVKPTLKFKAAAGQHILTEVWYQESIGQQLLLPRYGKSPDRQFAGENRAGGQP